MKFLVKHGRDSKSWCKHVPTMSTIKGCSCGFSTTDWSPCQANLDAGAGGQLIKIPQNQVEATIEEVAKNYSWGAEEETLQREVVFTNWRKLINYNIK